MGDGRINETGVWLDRTAHVTDISFLSFLINFFGQEKASVYDLGCGGGGYAKPLVAAGLDVACYDGSPHASAMSDGLCSTMDLARPIDLEPRDWVLSLEVGEHIPSQFEKVFMDNVVKSAKAGLILSWAVPQQKGFGHVNCQTNEYVISEIESRGFVHDPELQKVVRENVSFNYFLRTVMTFKSK